jgi:hypothetical protein
MDTIAAIFSPPLLAVLCGLAVGTGAVLFLIARRDGGGPLDLRTPLSWSEPVEMRLILYLIFGAACGGGALGARLLFEMATAGSLLGWLLILLVLFGFVCNLAFFYAAAGSLLQAALGSRGRPPFWFSPILSFLDGVIMDAGDLFARILITRAPEDEMRRGRTRDRHRDNWDPAYDAPPSQRRPVRQAAPGRRAEIEPVYDDDATSDSELQPAEVDSTVSGNRAPRGTQSRDIPRERLDLAIQEYEAALTPAQLQKLREMRSLVESFSQ